MKLGKLFINSLKFGINDDDSKHMATNSEEAIKNKIYSNNVVKKYKPNKKSYSQFGDNAQVELD